MIEYGDFVKGTCLDMCPLSERKLRVREKLIHVLERGPNGISKNVNASSLQSYMVKSYSRSAAGREGTKPENLRPPKILLETISYLLFDVINTKAVTWNVVYDFIHDRLMAVRQDMVVQSLTKSESITILQPIIKFYALAAYRLCNQALSCFDPTLNNKQLQECLKKLLSFYDLCSEVRVIDNKCCDYLFEVQPTFEALYILFNLGNDIALRRAVRVPLQYKTSLVKLATEISLSYKYGNYVRACRFIKDLPPLLLAVTSLHLPELRRRAFQRMSAAYNSKNLSFPLSLLAEILLYTSNVELEQDLIYYGLVTHDGAVYFTKQNFLSSQPAVQPRREKLVEDKLTDLGFDDILFK